jgi:GT2 family glycosyltransferase
VIAVDNASTDGSVAHLREHYPWVTTIALTENVG